MVIVWNVTDLAFLKKESGRHMCFSQSTSNSLEMSTGLTDSASISIFTTSKIKCLRQAWSPRLVGGSFFYVGGTWHPFLLKTIELQVFLDNGSLLNSSNSSACLSPIPSSSVDVLKLNSFGFCKNNKFTVYQMLWYLKHLLVQCVIEVSTFHHHTFNYSVTLLKIYKIRSIKLLQQEKHLAGMPK